MRHDLNGQRASAWDRKQALCVIAIIPINPPYPPLSGDKPVRPLVQFVLRPDKFTELGYLRLGETPGDEANCWINPDNIHIVEVLGTAHHIDGKWEVHALVAEDIRAAA